MLKIGITGNIASGKSEVEKIIRSLNYPVFDLDIISHDILNNDFNVKKLVKREFQTLKRNEIAAIVFNDETKKKKLEEIMHPVLKQKVKEIFKLNEDKKAVFVSGALIFEAGFDTLFDKIIFVDAKITLRKERLKKRNNLSDNEAQVRLNSQSLKFKDMAHFVILNDLGLDELRNETMRVLNSLIKG